MTELLERLEIIDVDRPLNLLLVSCTWTGKSGLIKQLAGTIKTEYSTDPIFKLDPEYGVIVVPLTTYTTITTLYQSILDKLDWRYTSSMKVGKLENLIGEACKKRGCKLIIIDEINQVVDINNEEHKKQFRKALRNLPKQTNRPLIITGTPEIRSYLSKEYQSANNYIELELPRLNLTNKEISVEINGKIDTKTETEIVLNIIKSLDDDAFEQTGIISNIQKEPDIIHLLVSISNGKLGALIDTFAYSICVAKRLRSHELNIKHINSAISIFKSNDLYFDEEDDYSVIIDKTWLLDYMNRMKKLKW